MKKIISFLLLCSILVIPAYAEEYETGRDLWKSWNGEYPSYSCGVWTSDSEDGTLIFGITDKKYKDEILSRVTDKSSVKTVVRKYSYSYLKEVEEAILEDADGKEVLSAVIFEKKNRVSVICSTELSFFEKLKLAGKYYGKYGKAVKVEYEEYMYDNSGDNTDRDGVMSSGSSPFVSTVIDILAGRYPLIRVGIIAGIVLIVAFVILRVKKKKTVHS